MSFAHNFKQGTYLGYLAILRIAVGYHFLTAAVPKLTSKFLTGKGLAEELVKTVVKDPFAWHRSFILDFVVPHAHAFSHLIAFGELAIGISLILGCLVRISASFGAFHNLNILLAIAIANGGPQLGINRLFIILQVVFVFASAGRSLGLDGLLKRKFPKSELF
jgi:thiosulfate dehydrogenase (quinone) large subunit